MNVQDLLTKKNQSLAEKVDCYGWIDLEIKRLKKHKDQLASELKEKGDGTHLGGTFKVLIITAERISPPPSAKVKAQVSHQWWTANSTTKAVTQIKVQNNEERMMA